MEVYFLLFREFFQKKEHFFPANSKYRHDRRTDPEQIQSEQREKARRLPYAEPSFTEQHADQKQFCRAEKAEKEIAEESCCPPSDSADLPQQIIEQPGCETSQRGGCNGYRLCADRHAHALPEQPRPQRAASRPLLIAQLVDTPAQLQDACLQIDPVDVQRLAPDR